MRSSGARYFSATKAYMPPIYTTGGGCDTPGCASRTKRASAHLDEARKLLKEPQLALPPPHQGDFPAAPGGNCEDGHHGYPGGLPVHSLANLLHARALAQTYRHIYGLELRNDFLVTAAIWHDSLKAPTLPWRADGSCGPEAKISGTPAHHVLALRSAFPRQLPQALL